MATRNEPMPKSTPYERNSSISRERGRRIEVLVAGLDSDTEALVSRALFSSGVAVSVSTNVYDALFGDEDHGFTCLILGGNLEDVRYIRSLGMELPILTLVTIPGAQARVMALEVGSDDCLGPQFAVTELVARVHSLTRRRHPMLECAKLTAGALSLVVDNYTAASNGSTVILTPIETDILKFLMESRGTIVSSSQIGRAVWGDSELRPNLVSVHLSNLRRKLSTSLDSDPIITHRSRGYMLTRGEEKR